MDSSSHYGLILFVEDEAPFRKIYKNVLEQKGYKLLEAMDGEMGWTLVKAKKPSLVLIDMVLPKLSGRELLKRIRADAETKDIPIIMCSVIGDKKEIESCLKEGADDYAIKGTFVPTEITVMIEMAIQKRNRPDKDRLKTTLVEGKHGKLEVKTVKLTSEPAKKKKAKKTS